MPQLSPRRPLPWAALAAAALLSSCARPPVVETPPPVAAARPVVVAPDTVELLVASTTDVHGNVRGWDYFAGTVDTLRGLARVATVVDSLRALAPGRVVLVDAGDIIQGNPLAYAGARLDTAGLNPVIAAMNVVGYDAAAIGNHEFNYGLRHLERAVRDARFPLLAWNAYRPGGQRYFQGAHLVERAGVRVGIVGGTTPGSMVWDRDNLAGRLEVRDIVPDMRRAVDSMRAQGAQVVVVVLHSGLDGASSYDSAATGLASENVAARVAREVPGIDLIVFGHSHRLVADSTINGVLLMQPRHHAGGVGVARIALERRPGEARVVAKRGEIVSVAGRREEPRVLAATQRHHDIAVRWVSDSIGWTAVPWRADSARVKDTPIIDLILETQRRLTGAQLASTAAFSLDASLDRGAITVAEIARLYPYDNTLRAVKLSGRQLRDYLEYSARYFGTVGTSEPAVDPKVPGYNFDIVAGVDYVLDLRRPVGGRVTRLTFRGRPVAPGDSFTMALNNYRQTGGGGYAMLRDAPVVYDKGEEIRQLLIDEVRRRGTLRPADVFRRNWRLEPASAAAGIMTAIRGNPFERGLARPGAGATSTGRVLRVISTNDFHGAFEPRVDAGGRPSGGAGRMATLVARARAGCTQRCTSILVDGGDLFQGTPASNLVFGRTVLDLYHRLHYDAAAMGNHEFDWGQETLRARLREARFPILGANVRDSAGRDVKWIRDTLTVVRNGVRVGLIGIASPDTPDDSRPENVRGLVFADPAPVIDTLARALRARGADAVVVLAHWGGFCRREPRPSCNGEVLTMTGRLSERVEAVVAGHTHSIIATRVKGTPVMQAASHGRNVTWVDVPLGGGEAAEPTVLFAADSVPTHPGADSIVARALARVAPIVNRRVATLAEPLSRSGDAQTLPNFVLLAQRTAARADLAAVNRGGLRVENIPAGEATWGTFYSLHPFGNMLVRVTLTGAQLRQWLEHQVRGRNPTLWIGGATVTVDTAQAVGSRIVAVALDDGRTLQDDATYTLVLNDYMASNADYGPPQGATVEPLGISDLDAVLRFAQSRTAPITASADAGFRFAR